MRIFKKLFSMIKSKNDKKVHFTSAIILAGGSGTRLGAGTPKQHLLLAGKEIVVRSMLAFEACGNIHEIVIVCRDGEQSIYEDYKERYGITKLTRVTVGGASRSDSALAGFEAISKASKYVAIHDAARCLIATEDIERTVHAAYTFGAATAATKATDTIKLSDNNGFIESTIDREKVFLAQTPQVFSRNIYMTAAYAAKRDGVGATDDNALVERMGFKVKLIETTSPNIKVTHAEDLIYAASILDKREKSDTPST